MPRVKHNARHSFAAGFNAAVPADIDLPFATPGMQGWKVKTENWAPDMDFSADSTRYEFTSITGTATPVNNGVQLATSAGADNTGAIVQAIDPNVIFTDNTKRMYMEASVEMNATTVGDNEWFVGWTSDQGTTIADFVAADGLSWAFDDGFGFGGLDGNTGVSFYARQSDVQQAVTSTKQLVSGSRHLLQMYYDGATYNLYVDGVKVANASRTTFNNDALMGFVAFFRTGEAAANTLDVHYQLIANEL
jgi:hypothetical protein